MFLSKARFSELEKRLEAIERAPNDLKTAIQVLRTEWEDTLDRLNRVMGRLNARTKRDLQPETPEEPPHQGFDPIEAARALAGRRKNVVLRHG